MKLVNQGEGMHNAAWRVTGVIAICAVLGMLAFLRHARLPGHGLLFRSGSELNALDSRTMSRSVLSRLDMAEQSGGGLSAPLKGEVFFSAEDVMDTAGVFALNLDTARVRGLWRGLWPAACQSRNVVVYVADVDERQSVVPLLARSPVQGSFVDTLGLIQLDRGRGLSWRHTLSAPVEVGDGWMAAVGPDGNIQRVNVDTKEWVSIAGAGLRPRFWQQDQQLLVCELAESLGTFVALSLDGSQRIPLPELEGMVAYGPSARAPYTLVVVPGWSIFAIESWSLRLFDWQKKKTRTIATSFHASGRMHWIE